MGLLGTIVSIVPTVADIVGKLFGAKSNDYVRFKIFNSENNDEEPSIYFEKTSDNRIMLHNSCGFPIHISMESAGVESDEGYLLEDCGGGLDVTDLIASHSAKYVNKLRISVNAEENKTNEGEIIALTHSGKIDRDIQGSISLGKYISVEVVDDDFLLIIHTGCTLKEISLLSIKGEGGEAERIYENVTPDAIIPAFNTSIKVSSEDLDDAKIITFPKAVASFIYSAILNVNVTLLCEVTELAKKNSNKEDRLLKLSNNEWDFLKKGRCLN